MSSSRSLLLLVLAGCNQLLGIKDTAPEPEAFFDGGIDAARGCPAHGAQPDSYSPFVHQVYVQDCRNYSSVPAGRAIATCFEGAAYVIHEGIAGQPLPPAGVTVSGSISAYSTPRLSPDGQRMLVISQDTTGAGTVYMFERQPDGSWLETPTGIPSNPYYTGLSTIAHVATGDRVLLRGTAVTEWELHGATWEQVLVQEPAVAGNAWDVMSMTSDGLHLLISDYRQALYADRTDVMQPFGMPVVLPGVPGVQDDFMTDDCARVYMSGFGALYYVEQN